MAENLTTKQAFERFYQNLDGMASASLPVGSIIPYLGSGIPSGGWFLCNGGQMSKTAYPELFEVIGYTYGGSGDVFNLPNLDGRFLELTVRYIIKAVSGKSQVVDANLDSQVALNTENIAKSRGSSNVNLLMNPWFTINQRGVTTGVLSNHYFVDRFKYVYNGTGSSITVTNNGLAYHVTNLSYLIQPIEPSLASFLDGKTVTASIMIDGVVRSATFTYDASKRDEAIAIQGTPWTYWYGGDGSVCFRCNVAGDYTIRAVKLELGDVSTLAYDSVPDYATELAKCQRYFQKGVIIGTQYYRYDAKNFQYVGRLPVSVRSGSNLSVSSVVCKAFATTGYEVNSSSITFATPSIETITVRCTFPSDIQTGCFATNISYELSADL